MSWLGAISIAALIVVVLMLLCRWWLFRDIDKLRKELKQLEHAVEVEEALGERSPETQARLNDLHHRTRAALVEEARRLRDVRDAHRR